MVEEHMVEGREVGRGGEDVPGAVWPLHELDCPDDVCLWGIGRPADVAMGPKAGKPVGGVAHPNWLEDVLLGYLGQRPATYALHDLAENHIPIPAIRHLDA